MTDGEKLYLRAVTVKARSLNSWARTAVEAPPAGADGESHPTTNPTASAEAADARPRGFTPMASPWGERNDWRFDDWRLDDWESPTRFSGPGRRPRRRALILQQRFAAQPYFTSWIDIDHLDEDLFAFLQFVPDVLDAVIGDLRHVEQPVGARHDLDEGAKIGDPLNFS